MHVAVGINASRVCVKSQLNEGSVLISRKWSTNSEKIILEGVELLIDSV